MNLRHLRARKVRVALTVSGVGAGVALVFSIGLINDTLVSAVRSSSRALGGAAEIEVAATDLTGLPATTTQRLIDVEGVQDTIPVVRTVSRTSVDGRALEVLYLGVTPDFASLFPKRLGEFTDFEVSGGLGALTGGAILSETVADELNASVGKPVTVQTPRGPRAVEVAGLVSGGALEVVNGGDFAVMWLPAAQSLFDKADRVDSIYIVTDPDVPVASVEDALADELDGAALIGPPGERAEVFERTFSTLAFLSSMAGLVALFVAVFVVYNTMSMTTSERRTEISLALALGASRRQVFASYLGEAAFLGAIASIGGGLAGLALAQVLVNSAIEGYRFVLPETTNGMLSVEPETLAVAVASGVAVSVLGAFVPVRRVLSVAPIEFLRPQAPFELGEREVHRGLTTILFVAGLIVTTALVTGFVATDLTWLGMASIGTALATTTFFLPLAVPVGIAIIRPFLHRIFSTEGRLAADALAKNVRRTTMTVAALLLSLGMVVGVGSAIESLNAQVDRSAHGWFGAPLYVSASSYTGFASDQPLPGDLEGELEKVDGVAHVYPGRYSFVNVGGEQAVVYALSVAEAAEDGSTDVLSAPGTDQDEFLRDMSAGGVVVSRFTARRLGLEEGDRLSLPTPSGRHSFPVMGGYDDLVPFDSMYMEYRTYLRYWKDEKADRFAVLPAEGVSHSALIDRLERVLASGDVPADVQTRAEVIGQVQDLSAGLISIARGIQLAALVVAALTIANTMFMAVLERRWEFGLQRAVGMGRSQLGRAVVVEASGIGALGAGGGVLLGILFGGLMLMMMEQQFQWRIPFTPQWLLMAGAVAGGIGLAAAASLYPRRLATSLPIVECLRYE
ncbi:MAG: ABC transporter permease [Actinomycetota bacterium]|nr:ABC transporter permease [Actinomycetota bacterium]